jgi:cytochrome c oxidase assembly protein subunit 15
MVTEMHPPKGSLTTAVFGTTVAIWLVGYISRLPAVMAPSWLVGLAMLGCLFLGGLLLGREINMGRWFGARLGAWVGVLNLLILGSLLGGERPGQVVPSALIWIPGSILVSALLAAVGSWCGQRWFAAKRPFENWGGAIFWVAVSATMLLLAVGGLVTSADAGMAVVDWPNSFGYNMFLYPLSKMTGGIYYEHAHRLMGFLVGMTTLFAAIVTQRVDGRRWVRRLAWVAVVAVVVQAILGGLRVTERSLLLAMTHGIFAQLFFSTLVALAAFTSSGWKSAHAAVTRPGVRWERIFAMLLVCLVVLQLVLGAAQRHFQELLLAHILSGLAIVAPIAVHVGFRTWGMNGEQKLLRRLGLTLVGLVGLQLLLGFGAYLATRGAANGELPAAANLLVATFHQWTGAVLLATTVLIACWNHRLLAPATHREAAAAR